MRFPDGHRLGRGPGSDLFRHRRIARHLWRRALDIEQILLARIGPIMEFGREVIALVQLLRQIAPPNREMQNSPRSATLAARASVPDVPVDDGDGEDAL